MAFIIENDIVISFAEFDDVLKLDQRLFDSNEGITDEIVEGHLIRATQRVLTRFRATDWWVGYYKNRSDPAGNPFRTIADIPDLEANSIIRRSQAFTDLVVYVALSEYTLPMVADFGNDESEERHKMAYYSNSAQTLFGELVNLGDWYDFNNDGTVQSEEKQPGNYSLKRIR